MCWDEPISAAADCLLRRKGEAQTGEQQNRGEVVGDQANTLNGHAHEFVSQQGEPEAHHDARIDDKADDQGSHGRYGDQGEYGQSDPAELDEDFQACVVKVESPALSDAAIAP